MTRNIYKFYGEIVSKTNIHTTIDYDKEKVIIDKITIQSDSYENCKYYQEKNIINTVENERDRLYIVRIYLKNKEYEDYAEKLFNSLHQ